MGHDIYGVNQSQQQIAYARFHMFNDSAHDLYQLLDAKECDGGVSGIGAKKTFSKQQIEQALSQLQKRLDRFNHQSIDLDDQQIKRFLTDCLETAEEEGQVDVCFA
ncbi:hypothetical protein ACKXGF_09795 [Alkalibacillus sp. S2W]|uniref:hypothetical protein n=1 Tax=Alkalibacillus sp. S2W TaxID=3386553 RepID=UPI00398D6662